MYTVHCTGNQSELDLIKNGIYLSLFFYNFEWHAGSKRIDYLYATHRLIPSKVDIFLHISHSNSFEYLFFKNGKYPLFASTF